MRRKLMICFSAALILLPLLYITACESTSNDQLSSRSYSGHENDMDANNFIKVYPKARGTRLDDCQLCHSGGTLQKYTLDASGNIQYDAGGAPITSAEKINNACTWCHYYETPDTTTYTADSHPKSYYETLNSYGKAYMDNGRSVAALKAIATLNSDGDVDDEGNPYSNETEILDNRFPGNPNSNPGQPLVPYVELTWNQITSATPVHTQFLLMNANKQQYDDYATYTGLTMANLLTLAGVDMTDVTGITVFAPDGFKVQFNLASINMTYPEATFYQQSGFNYQNSDTIYDCTNYPTNTYGLGHLDPINSDINPDGLRLMWAYYRESDEMVMSYYNVTAGKLDGEGPYRVVVPQTDVNSTLPGKPDRGSQKSQKATDDGYNYFGKLKDHNAGSCSRGACIIRLDYPSDHIGSTSYEEYDTTNGWSLIEDRKVIIYGHGAAK